MLYAVSMGSLRVGSLYPGHVSECVCMCSALQKCGGLVCSRRHNSLVRWDHLMRLSSSDVVIVTPTGEEIYLPATGKQIPTTFTDYTLGASSSWRHIGQLCIPILNRPAENFLGKSITNGCFDSALHSTVCIRSPSLSAHTKSLLSFLSLAEAIPTGELL